jgi:hypothetical protein
MPGAPRPGYFLCYSGVEFRVLLMTTSLRKAYHCMIGDLPRKRGRHLLRSPRMLALLNYLPLLIMADLNPRAHIREPACPRAHIRDDDIVF